MTSQKAAAKETTPTPAPSPRFTDTRFILCYGYVIKACDTCDMTCEHVSRQGKLWPFFPCALDLSASVGFHTASFSTDFKQYLTR